MVALLFVTLGTLNPRFLTLSNLEAVSLQIAEIGLVAIPMAFVIMSGSIDFSVGSVASVSAIVFAMVASSTQSVALGMAAGLAMGLGAGAVNGFLVAFANLNPLVITLGFLNVWGGVALFLNNGSTVTGLPPVSRDIAQFTLFGVPTSILVLIAAVVVSWVVLAKRPFGRHLLAVGGNPTAAHIMGLSVRGVRMRLFLVSGLGAAVAGMLLAMKLQAAPPTLGSGMELTALTVVLLGGVAFEGGYGKISGVVAGLLFVGALRNGLVLLGVSQFLQTVVVGLTLVAAISLDKTVQGTLRSAWTGGAGRKPPAGGGQRTSQGASQGADAVQPATSAGAGQGTSQRTSQGAGQGASQGADAVQPATSAGAGAGAGARPISQTAAPKGETVAAGW
ncbi:MAG: ABC transporter permease [Bifidobacteriaceae bacterium]|nr:ABC transporter permease [Bifidobacteriaceae bacterium]